LSGFGIAWNVRRFTPIFCQPCLAENHH
jgi:hypothetical protein